MNTLQKILSAVLVLAMLVVAGAALAQDETTTDDSATTVCTALRETRGEHPLQAALDELGLTRQDIRDYIEAGGTLEDFLSENGIDFEALRAEHEAEREAAKLVCVDELEANGTISNEQAEQLRDAIENDTLRELLQSGEFDDVFPFGRGNGEGHHRGGKGGRGRGNGFGGFGEGLGSGSIGDTTDA